MLDAFVDGSATEVLDRADELEATGPAFVLELDGTEFRETFAVPSSTLAELRRAAVTGRVPRPESLSELMADGLIDRTLGLTTRGRRALALDRRAAHHEAPPVPAPAISFRGPVPERARDELSHALRVVAEVAPRPVLHIHGSITRHEDPAVARPVVAKAALDLGRHVVRAHVAAASEHEAIDLLEARVHRNLRRLADRAAVERREGRAPTEGEWRHRNVVPPRPLHYPRPAAERRVVRRKTYSAAPTSPGEAAAEMALLDHDFHVFVDLQTGEDTLVHTRPDGVLALRRGDRSGVYVEPFVLDAEPVPVLAVEAAIEHLNATDEPFVFFVDEASGRGTILYHRYDGHYGLVSAAG